MKNWKKTSKFWSIFNKEKEQRVRSEAEERNLICNGAILLEKQVSSYLGRGTIIITEPLKTYSAMEIRQATNNYDNQLIVGREIATVYKGIFDGRTVAIKVYGGANPHIDLVNFSLNQVTIKQLINHKNVVRLYGCCLETLVPILVYEFIANGTLFHRLHAKGYPNRCRISWIDRVRIAYEISYALSYMHFGTIKPIVHLDVQSANIFLDENLTAKLTNFGFSVLVSPADTFRSRCVEGLPGYTDPEYHETLRVTDKCDVYSFGVVLVELLTGVDPNVMFLNGMSLIDKFVSVMAEEQNISMIVHHIVMEEGINEDIKVFAEIALRCVRKKGDERPSIKEVAMELKRLEHLVKSRGNDTGDLTAMNGAQEGLQRR